MIKLHAIFWGKSEKRTSQNLLCTGFRHACVLWVLELYMVITSSQEITLKHATTLLCNQRHKPFSFIPKYAFAYGCAPTNACHETVICSRTPKTYVQVGPASSEHGKIEITLYLKSSRNHRLCLSWVKLLSNLKFAKIGRIFTWCILFVRFRARG